MKGKQNVELKPANIWHLNKEQVRQWWIAVNPSKQFHPAEDYEV